MRTRPRSIRFLPSFDRLPSRIALSGIPAYMSPTDTIAPAPAVSPPTDCVVSPMGAIMLGPDEDPTDLVISPMGAIMLGPDEDPTDVASPPIPNVPGMDVPSPTNIVVSQAAPVMLAVNSAPTTYAPTAADPAMGTCPPLMSYPTVSYV